MHEKLSKNCHNFQCNKIPLFFLVHLPICYSVIHIVVNNAPTLTVTNGNSVTLEPGQNGVIVVELSDPDAGDLDSVTLLPAPGYNTSCLTISGKTVTVDTSNLVACDIA